MRLSRGTALAAAEDAQVCQPPAPKAAAQPDPRGQTAGSSLQRCKGINLPFLFLLLPQLLKNAASLSPNPDALGILSYVSYLTGLFGNTLLLSYFTAKAEHSAVLVQAIGIASSFAVLTQIRIAGFMPRAVYAATATIVACTATLTALKLSGRLDASKQGQRVWAAWQKVLGLAGLAVVPQVLWTALVGTPTLLPSLTTFGLGCAMLVLSAAGRLPPAIESAWSGLSAGTATLLFVLQPVAQLIKNFQDPASLSGLSLATIQLAACGNALMVPRALFTRDLIWLVGSSWGSLVFGWAQALSLWLGTNPATGGRYLSTPVFAGCTALLWSWFGFVAWMDARAKRGGDGAQAGEATPAK
ncbi:hypothetical protein N2152v2_001276 [Parachlorella kessleri]